MFAVGWILSALASTVAPTTFVVRGHVVDALAHGAANDRRVWVTVHDPSPAGGRRLLRLSDGAPGPAIPRRAVFVDSCAPAAGDERFLFVDDDGVVDDAGARLIARRGLFALADPDLLYRADLCPLAAAGELRLMVPEGIAVRAPDGGLRVLAFRHQARAYSGDVQSGLRPGRPYAGALSLYAPRLVDADVDGDGKLDLVVVHEQRLAVFLRDEGGLLREAPAVALDLLATVGVDDPDEQDLRVHIADVDGDRRADALVGVTAGGLPDRSRAYLITSRKAPLDAVTQLWDKSGLSLPLAVVARGGAPRVLVCEADTSLVALGATLLSGEVDLDLALVTVVGPSRHATDGPALAASIDVRRGTRHGALPVLTVDFDDDGLTDLLDIGRIGRAALYRGTPQGFAANPAAQFDVPRFVSAVSLPRDRAVVLLGPPERDGKGVFTRVTVLRVAAPAKTAPASKRTWR